MASIQCIKQQQADASLWGAQGEDQSFDQVQCRVTLPVASMASHPSWGKGVFIGLGVATWPWNAQATLSAFRAQMPATASLNYPPGIRECHRPCEVNPSARRVQALRNGKIVVFDSEHRAEEWQLSDDILKKNKSHEADFVESIGDGHPLILCSQSKCRLVNEGTGQEESAWGAEGRILGLASVGKSVFALEFRSNKCSVCDVFSKVQVGTLPISSAPVSARCISAVDDSNHFGVMEEHQIALFDIRRITTPVATLPGRYECAALRGDTVLAAIGASVIVFRCPADRHCKSHGSEQHTAPILSIAWTMTTRITSDASGHLLASDIKEL